MLDLSTVRARGDRADVEAAGSSPGGVICFRASDDAASALEPVRPAIVAASALVAGCITCRLLR